MKKNRDVLTAVILMVFFTGCYTQFVMVDKTPPQPKEVVTWEVDSATGDTVKVVRQVDTVQVRTQDNQTCIWERDLMGYPYLRCYDSFYPRDWFYYNNSPWWYNDYPYYSGYYSGGYYYHGRRYHDYDEHYHDNGVGTPHRTEPVEPSGSSYRSRVRGVPSPNSAAPVQRGSGGATASTGSSSGEKSASTGSNAPVKGDIIIPAEGGNKTIIVHERRSGVPQAGTAAPVQNTTPPPAQSRTAEVNSNSSPPPPPAPSQPSAPAVKPSQQQSSPQQGDGERRPRHRNSRSW